MQRKRGYIKWLNSHKGYGLIQPSDGSDEVFVRFSGDVEVESNNLQEGIEVRYDEVDFGKGPQARNVRPN